MLNETKSDLATSTAELLGDVLREFVLNKTALSVTSAQDGEHVTLGINYDPTDAGRIIGGRGMHFRSLQAFVNTIGLRHDLIFDITPLSEPAGGMAKRYEAFKGSDEWRYNEILLLLMRLVRAVVEHDDVVSIETKGLPNFTTKLTVHVAKLESATVIRTMTFGMVNPTDQSQTGWLRILANAIGKANKRTLIVDVIADVEAEERQPKNLANDLPEGSNLRPRQVKKFSR